MSTVAGFVAIGVVAGALIIGAPLGAPLIAGALWTSGAVALGAEVVHAAHTCGAGKGGCGSAIAMAGIGSVGGRYLRPLQAARTTARQVDAPWGGLHQYRHGTGPMTAIEHINYRHAFESGFTDVSRFAQGTRAADISSYVDDALRYGTVSQNGASVVHDLGRTIGFDQAGNAVSGIQVWIRHGAIRTAYPVAP